MLSMEPMTLGSPTHSPSSSPNTSFLPPLLMVEFNQPTSPRTNSLSPTKGRTLAFANSPPIRPTPQHQVQYNSPLRQKANPNASFSNKINGPPTQGLFDTLHQPDWNTSQPIQSPVLTLTSPVHNSSYGLSQDNYFTQVDSPLAANASFARNQPKFNNSQNFNNSMAQSPVLSNNDSYCYSSPTTEMNYEESSEFWVTIFGFPLSASSMVLTQFSNCGNIIEKKFPNQGNWLWLRYSSRSEVGRALALNARILPGNLMIGVQVCQNPPQSKRGGARQLATGPSRSILNTSSNLPNASNTANAGAQRASGTISRALEYVFGW